MLKDRLSDYRSQMSNLADRHEMILASDAVCMLEQLQDDLEDYEKNKWIPVTEKMPEEHDSIFAKFKGTGNWENGMFEKTSRYVIAKVMYDDGTVLAERAHTTDGIWRTEKPVLGGRVIAWQPFPKVYEGE